MADIIKYKGRLFKAVDYKGGQAKDRQSLLKAGKEILQALNKIEAEKKQLAKKNPISHDEYVKFDKKLDEIGSSSKYLELDIEDYIEHTNHDLNNMIDNIYKKFSEIAYIKLETRVEYKLKKDCDLTIENIENKGNPEAIKYKGKIYKIIKE